MFRKKHVNFVIKDRSIRYLVSTEPTIDGVVDYGEQFFEPNIITDGKIVNKDAFYRVLKKLVKDKKWKNKSLSFCVPDSFVTIREIFVPKHLKENEIKSYIQLEMEDSIRLPFSDPVFDFDIVDEQSEQSKIVLFAYPKERLDEFIAAFDYAKLKVKVADLSSLSLYRLYYQLDLASRNEHLLSVQWCKDALVLTAFNQTKTMFTRYVTSPLSEDSWSWSISENNLTWNGEESEWEEAMNDQMVTIDRFMNFYQYSIMDGTAEFSKLLLSGDMPSLEKIDSLLRERYDITIETTQKWEKRLKISANFTDVLGLSVKNK